MASQSNQCSAQVSSDLYVFMDSLREPVGLLSPSLPPAVLFSVLQGELKRINFLNFEALLKGLEEKEDVLIKEGKKEQL